MMYSINDEMQANHNDLTGKSSLAVGNDTRENAQNTTHLDNGNNFNFGQFPTDPPQKKQEKKMMTRNTFIVAFIAIIALVVIAVALTLAIKFGNREDSSTSALSVRS